MQMNWDERHWWRAAGEVLSKPTRSAWFRRRLRLGVEKTMAKCAGKKRHNSYRAAQLASERMLEAGQGLLTPYYCDECGGYHIGHDRALLVPAVKRLPISSPSYHARRHDRIPLREE